MKITQLTFYFLILSICFTTSCIEDEEPVDIDPEEEDLYDISDSDADGLIDISTIDELYLISIDRSIDTLSAYQGYELLKNLDFENTSDYKFDSLRVMLTDGAGWLPIGSSNSAFNKVFEGNNFTISNLRINRTTDYNGLFGATGESSMLQNVRVQYASFLGGEYSGGLIGFNSGGSVENCSVDGRMIVGSNSAGLIGYDTNGTIMDSFTSGTILSENGSGIGGLIGTYRNSSSQETNVSNCYSTANVTGITYVGGLVGYRSGGWIYIESSYATGRITAFGRYVGGLGGYVAGNINACYATGQVSSSDIYVGGFIGRLNEGSITTSYALGSVNGSSNFGGFTGNNSGSITATNYWDTQTSGNPTSLGNATGLSTNELQNQTTTDGIYLTWNGTLWNFGTSSQYPALKNMPGGLEMQRN